MSTLTYTTGTFTPAATETAARKPAWRRFVDALVLSQQRRADREIARYIASHGGLLTDDMERQIMSRVTTPRQVL